MRRVPQRVHSQRLRGQEFLARFDPAQDAGVSVLIPIGHFDSPPLDAVGAGAELYDLSEPGRLQNAAASTYPLADESPDLAARVGCGHGPLASAPLRPLTVALITAGLTFVAVFLLVVIVRLIARQGRGGE